MPKIVNLGEVKDLRQEWDKVKAAITAGNVESFYLQVVTVDGRELSFMGGGYKKNPEGAARAALRISMARMRSEDEALDEDQPDFATTRH